MTEPERLAPYVDPRLSDADLARQWGKIDRALSERPGRGRGWLLSGLMAAVVAIAAVLLVARKPATPSAWDGAVLESGTAPTSVALADGSRIELFPASQVRVEESRARTIRLDLRAGSARFDVTHREGRTFHVAARGVTVRVVGTRFTVGIAKAPEPGGPERVTVTVTEGIVEAEVRGERLRIRADESWSTLVGPERPVATGTNEPADGSQGATEVPPTTGGGPSSGASVAAKASSPPGSRPATTEPTGAQELFERANAARQGGDARAAAAAYDALIRIHPHDSRAGLAAFELGRIRMDQLGDVSGAVTALKRAVALAPGSGFREDALARLVRAYATMGDPGRCSGAKKTYLESYPSGVHAASIQKACGGI